MRRLNLILTLTSLSVLLVTVERFSFTTKILLQPYNFLRLHELVQMVFIILFTVILPFLALHEISDNFKLLQKKGGLLLGTLFIVGIYFYATGNGVHEIASFFFNNYCDTKNIVGNLCNGLFFNDYYLGNILYFIGAALYTIVLFVLERQNPAKQFERKDKIMLFINALIFSFAIFAYAAFDRVLVGLAYSIFLAIVSLGFLLTAKKDFFRLPYTMYATVCYVLATIASLIVRFR